MKQEVVRSVVARLTLPLVVVLAAACTQEAQSSDTSGTTRSLLNQRAATDAASPAEPAAVPQGAQLTPSQLGMNLGSPDAPVAVVEFVDYGCGFCRQFHLETFATLREEFIDTGMFQWKFLPFVGGQFANSAAVTEAAECSLEFGGPVFSAISDGLWQNQGEWKNSDDPAGVVRGWLGAAGVELEQFDSCMEDDRRLARIESATALANELGVRATPTFWIQGVGPIQGSLPLETFRQIFTEVHAAMTEEDPAA